MKERLVGLVSEFMDAQQRVESGEAEAATVLVGDREFLMRRSVDGAIRSTTNPDEGICGTTWLPSPDRPLGYPEDLPFLPDRRSSLIELRDKGRSFLSWLKTTDPEGLSAAVELELQELGWVRVEERGIVLGLIGREVEFRRAGSRCRVTVHRDFGHGAKVRLVVHRSIEERLDTA